MDSLLLSIQHLEKKGNFSRANLRKEEGGNERGKDKWKENMKYRMKEEQEARRKNGWNDKSRCF